MTTTDKLIGQIKQQLGRLNHAFDDAPCIAQLSGPAVVIEVIVRTAVEKSGIEMDWGYCGGRALVHSHGDAQKCRRELFCAIPQSDLTLSDMAPDTINNDKGEGLH